MFKIFNSSNAKVKNATLAIDVRYNQLPYIRILLLIGAIAFPVAGHLLLYFDTNAIEFLSIRYFISATFLTLLILSIKTDHFEKHLISYSYLSVYPAMMFIIWLVGLNNYNIYYSTVMFLAVFAVCQFIYHKWFLYFFNLSLILYTIFFIFLTDNVSFAPHCVLFCLVVALIIRSFSLHYHNRMIEEIDILNSSLLRVNENLEEKVQERTLLLDSKNKELESYFYIFSHDLKTPLKNIDAFSKLLIKDVKEDKKKNINNYFKIISQSVQRMEDIVQDLLTYGLMGISQCQFEKVNISILLDELISSSYSALIGDDLEIRINENIPKHVIANKNQITMLFQNLIGNGIIYNNSIPKIIEIGGADKEDSYQFYVKDNGIGIEEEYQDQVFEMFKRLHNKDKYEGTGIGLAICRRVVLNHKGQISLINNIEEGSHFVFNISKSLSEESDNSQA